ncbi:MAG: DUF11 domain-containing protein, partial [bacterium]|nr:DUF11 domain-containing protein [bacterium]
MKTSVRIALLATFLVAGAIQGQQPVPVGSEFQVNTYTTWEQADPFVAVDSGGNFIVVWTGPTGLGDNFRNKAQRYAQDGAPIGGEFEIKAANGGGYYFSPSVGVSGDGDFVVVWNANDMSLSYDIVFGRRFGSDGAPIGDAFQVNSFTTVYQYSTGNSSVVVGSEGNFVVVWRADGSGGTDNDGRSIWGRRYASGGTALGGEFQVNSYTTSNQVSPSVAIDSDGDFVVVWSSPGSAGTDNDANSIQGQRYASDGTALGGEFQINSYTTNSQGGPSVAVDWDGDFVVVWYSGGSSGTDNDGNSIQGQRYASDGTANGDEFQVNSYTTSSQGGPSVAVDSAGDFVVAWHSNGSSGTDNDSTSIQGQYYASDGTASGDEFQINSYTTNHQDSPSVAAAPNGDFVVMWESRGSSGSDNDGDSIQGQRFVVTTADLSVTKDDAVTEATPGESVIYTIAASNNGPGDVPSASLTDIFPPELTCGWTSYSTGGATGNTSGSGELSDTLTMPAGSSVIYTATCDIDPAATGTLSNTATISSPVTDSNTADNSGTDDDTILVPEADLSVTKSDASDPVVVDSSLTYTINAGNAGSSQATSVLVTDALPAEVSFVSAAGTGWICNQVGGAVSCSRPTLGVGAAPGITLTVTTPADPGVITNNVAVGGADIDPNAGNNSSMETTTVLEDFIFVDGFESG